MRKDVVMNDILPFNDGVNIDTDDSLVGRIGNSPYRHWVDRRVAELSVRHRIFGNALDSILNLLKEVIHQFGKEPSFCQILFFYDLYLTVITYL